MVKKILVCILAGICLLSACGSNAGGDSATVASTSESTVATTDEKAGQYEKAETALADKRFDEARELYLALGDYQDSAEKLRECGYQMALLAMEENRYEDASALLTELNDYKDSSSLLSRAHYQIAMQKAEKGAYTEAVSILRKLGDFEDAMEQLKQIKWKMLRDYIEENGEEKSWTAGSKSLSAGNYANDNRLSPVVISIYFDKENNIVLAIDGIIIGSTGGVAVTHTLSGNVTISQNEDTAPVYFEDSVRYSLNNDSYKVKMIYKGHIKPSVYFGEDDIHIDSFRQTGSIGTQSFNSTNHKDSVAPEIFPQSINSSVTNAKELLAQTELPISMKDLGFVWNELFDEEDLSADIFEENEEPSEEEDEEGTLLFNKIAAEERMGIDIAETLIKDYSGPHKGLNLLRSVLQSMRSVEGVYYQQGSVGSYKATLTYYLHYGAPYLHIEYTNFRGDINDAVVEVSEDDEYPLIVKTTGVTTWGVDTEWVIQIAPDKMHVEWGSSKYDLTREKP